MGINYGAVVYLTKRNRQTVKEARQVKKEEAGRTIKEKFIEEVKPPVTAKNNKQKEFLAALANYDVIVFEAPAGVGKSYLTMSEVSDWLKKGLYDKCVISRPNISMGSSLGLLPGTISEKYEPYLLPLIDVMSNRYGRGWYDTAVKNGQIELLPLEYVRGRSFNCVVVVDEAQNCKPDEVYTILTRVGEGAKLIMIGDRTQHDLKGETGIQWLCKFVEEHSELSEHIKVIKATSDDIVRSGLCKTMVKAKERSLNV